MNAMLYTAADMAAESKRTMVEVTVSARKRIRVLAAKADMSMKEYMEWLAELAEQRELLPGLATSTPSGASLTGTARAEYSDGSEVSGT